MTEQPLPPVTETPKVEAKTILAEATQSESLLHLFLALEPYVKDGWDVVVSDDPIKRMVGYTAYRVEEGVELSRDFKVPIDCMGVEARKYLRELFFMRTAKGRQSVPDYLKKPRFVAWVKRRIALDSPDDILWQDLVLGLREP